MLAFLQGCPLISPDSYERFLRDIGSQIDGADREMKEKAEHPEGNRGQLPKAHP